MRTEPEPTNTDHASTNIAHFTGEEGGVWHVYIEGSVHVFDLDARTVERRPGPDAAVLDSVGPRPLRAIITCAVGVGGDWTIESDDPRITYFLHSSSTIERIEQVEGQP